MEFTILSLSLLLLKMDYELYKERDKKSIYIWIAVISMVIGSLIEKSRI